MAVCPGLPATWSSKPSLFPFASSDICGFDLNQVCLLQGHSVYFLSAPMVRSKTSQEQKDQLAIAVANWKEKNILQLCFEPVLALDFLLKPLLCPRCEAGPAEERGRMALRGTSRPCQNVAMSGAGDVSRGAMLQVRSAPSLQGLPG